MADLRPRRPLFARQSRTSPAPVRDGQNPAAVPDQKTAGRCNLPHPAPVGLPETMTASDPSPRQGGRDSRLPQQIQNTAPRLKTFLRRLCRGAGRRCEAEVEDLLQDVMERALRYRHAFDPAAGSLENWLMKTAFHTFLNHRDRIAKAPAGLGTEDAMVADPVTETAESRDEIGFLLRQLSPIEQDVVLRFHRQRESIDEIAQALDMPPGTVKSHLHRARQRLARLQLAQQRRDEEAR